MAFNKRLILKVIELVLAIVIVGLLESHDIVPPRTMLVCGTFVGFIIIGVALVTALAISAELDKRIDMLLCIAGGILFITSGSLIIDLWSDAVTPFGVGKNSKDVAIASGAIAIINGIVYLVDCFLTFKS